MRAVIFTLAALIVAAAPLIAQTAPVIGGDAVPGQPAVVAATSTVTSRQVKLQSSVMLCVDGANYTVCPSGGVRESFQLIAANVPSAAATVFGGDYILSQMCGGYGTVTLQVRNPDGSTYSTILTKTASDSAGGTGLALGSYAVVRMTVSGTTTCSAILARVPA